MGGLSYYFLFLFPFRFQATQCVQRNVMRTMKGYVAFALASSLVKVVGGAILDNVEFRPVGIMNQSGAQAPHEPIRADKMGEFDDIAAL